MVVGVRRAPRIDSNHAAIVRALKDVGCSVQSLASIGRGCPDLLVAYRGKTFVIEVKRPAGPKGGVSRASLNDAQAKWRAAWRGPVGVVRDGAQAVRYVLGGL